MKKIKVIILLFSIILLSGCSGTYNIKINEDLSIEENVNFTIPKDNDSYEKTVKLFEDNNISEKKYEVVASDENVKVTYNEKYDSIEDYIINSKLYKNLFERINYSIDRKKLNISTESKFKLDNSLSSNITDDYNVSLLQINIETPYKVVENDADSVSENIYSWVLNKDTTDKKINMVININSKSNNYISIIVLILIGIVSIGSIIYVLSKTIKRQKI